MMPASLLEWKEVNTVGGSLGPSSNALRILVEDKNDLVYLTDRVNGAEGELGVHVSRGGSKDKYRWDLKTYQPLRKPMIISTKISPVVNLPFYKELQDLALTVAEESFIQNFRFDPSQVAHLNTF